MGGHYIPNNNIAIFLTATPDIHIHLYTDIKMYCLSIFAFLISV